MKRETKIITKQQAASLLRGQLLPYFGYGTKLKDGRIVGHGPNHGEYTLTIPDRTDTIKWSEVL